MPNPNLYFVCVYQRLSEKSRRPEQWSILRIFSEALSHGKITARIGSADDLNFIAIDFY